MIPNHLKFKRKRENLLLVLITLLTVGCCCVTGHINAKVLDFPA